MLEVLWAWDYSYYSTPDYGKYKLGFITSFPPAVSAVQCRLESGYEMSVWFIYFIPVNISSSFSPIKASFYFPTLPPSLNWTRRINRKWKGTFPILEFADQNSTPSPNLPCSSRVGLPFSSISSLYSWNIKWGGNVSSIETTNISIFKLQLCANSSFASFHLDPSILCHLLYKISPAEFWGEIKPFIVVQYCVLCK